MIDGVLVHPLKIIPDERGRILHMLRRDDPHFERFGEIYFSVIYPGVVKGWHLHKTMTLNYAVVSGMVKLVLYDEREQSKTLGEIYEILTGEQRYALVRIPPGVWNGFQCVGSSPAIVANCATQPHDPAEIVRMDPHQNRIPYDWKAAPGGDR